MNPALKIGSALLLFALPAQAVTINLIYTDDAYGSGSNTFFGQTPSAKLALEKAAADIGAVITSSLAAIDTTHFEATSGGATGIVDWTINYTDPKTGSSIDLAPLSIAADQINIYVGTRALLGSTLGVGGPSGASVAESTTYFNEADVPAAIALAEDAGNLEMGRGGGPVMGTLLSGRASYGAIAGSIWFDNDINNDGMFDAIGTLSDQWHFDPNTAVEPNRSDLYSVALHEMLHAIGFGTSETWQSLANNGTWIGANVNVLFGGIGTGLVTLDGHVAEGLSGFRLSDGLAQESVMDPSVTQGMRKELTDLDLAFLRDLGYLTIPEAAVTWLLAAGAVGLFAVNRRRIRPV